MSPPRKRTRMTLGPCTTKPLPEADVKSEPELIIISDDDEGAGTSSGSQVNRPSKSEQERVEVVGDALEELLRTCSRVLPEDENVRASRKLRKKYDAMSEDDKASVTLREMITLNRQKVEKDKNNIYVYLAAVKDELARHKKVSRPRDDGLKERPKETASTSGTDNRAQDSPRPSTSGLRGQETSARHVKKLERALRECHAAIKALEEQACDLDDEVNSSYVRVSIYKKKCVQIYKKLAELNGYTTSLGRRQDKKHRLECSRFPEINAKLEELIQSRKARGVECFPDYADVYKACRETNESCRLGMNHGNLLNEAKKTFYAVGEKLKAIRVHDDQEVLNSYLPEDEASQLDPVRNDENAERQLESNSKIAKQRLDEVFEEFERREMCEKNTQGSGEEDVVGDDDSDSENADMNDTDTDINGKKTDDTSQNVRDSKESLICAQEEADPSDDEVVVLE